MRVFTYKGFTVEIGELPEPRQAYWKITSIPHQFEFYGGLYVVNLVECGSWQDLELIAKREVERIIREWAGRKEAETKPV